jgi:hypothetical protein
VLIAYVVLAYTKLGKPLYSSRIILNDTNPVFEETAASALLMTFCLEMIKVVIPYNQFLLVTNDEINSAEDLSLQLWDSDKYVKVLSVRPLFVIDSLPADAARTISSVAWLCPSKS